MMSYFEEKMSEIMEKTKEPREKLEEEIKHFVKEYPEISSVVAGAAATALLKQIFPTTEQRNMKVRQRYFYDGKFRWRLKRPLKTYEMRILEDCIAEGGKIGDVLSELKVLKK